MRSDGSSHAYPAFRIGGLVAGDHEVVALYDVELVRVTSSRLVPLLTSGDLARELHVRSAAIMGMYDLRVSADGRIFFVASVIGRGGCWNPQLERTAGRTVRLLHASTSRDGICR